MQVLSNMSVNNDKIVFWDELCFQSIFKNTGTFSQKNGVNCFIFLYI